MKRSGSLRRKQSLRQAYAEKLKARAPEMARRAVKADFARKGQKPLKKVAPARRRQMTEYLTVRADFLAEHPNCEICTVRQDDGEAVRIRPATEVHHYRGRVGRLLADPRFFIASCRNCREWPHENRKEAERLKMIAPRPEMDVWPGVEK